ncbi:hypothetical protein ACLOJK_037854 [Asimina triloba]
MKGLAIQQHPVPVVEENMSNLTSASGEASASSGNRAENGSVYPRSFPSPPPPPLKKKRSLPGNPADPDAEVIALSPKTLMATNRFVCEICNKGFQRDQNLQLHRRGHNLPWKLRQRTSKEVRKRVYVCPETSCVHHDPSRALGDLTGIKKHFCRKHGEKKWKCDKCSKRYAVQSDWKAHSKTCGTREYRCDCGNLFSRRDSFITHRAFCDALAEESSRTITAASNPDLLSNQATPSTPHDPTAHVDLQDHQRFPGIFRSTENNSSNSNMDLQSVVLPLKRDQELPPWLSSPPPLVGGAGPGPPSSQTSASLNHLDLPSSIFSTRLDPEFSQACQASASPHMSATALLQRATQMGATMSKLSSSPSILGPYQAHMTRNATAASAAPGASFGLSLSSNEQMASSFFQGQNTAFGNKAAHLLDHSTTGAEEASSSLLQNMMKTLSSAAGFEGSFEEAFGDVFGQKKRAGNDPANLPKSQHPTPRNHEQGGSNPVGQNDELTRDFLGLRAFSHRDILNMATLNPLNSSSSYEQAPNQKPWQG